MNDAGPLLRDRLLRMEKTAALRERLYAAPELHYLFFELTERCHLRCLHCGSGCGPEEGRFLDTEKVLELIDAAVAYEPRVHIVLTGGEPLLHPDFNRIVRHLGGCGAFWSVVTNGTLLDVERADLLRRCRVFSVSVSLDGEEREHNALRCSPEAFARALRGIRLLCAQAIRVQVTTVAAGEALNRLDEIAELVRSLGVSSWKLLNIEPIGRALDNAELVPDREALLRLLDYIRQKRRDDPALHLTYGCAHFLPLAYEEEVRKSCFLCGAGTMVAGIRCGGDIVGCLDIEQRPELVQGNVYRDDFITVWRERFAPFRTDRSARSSRCRACEWRRLCAGDSMHTWDFDRDEPRMCLLCRPETDASPAAPE